MNSELIQHLDAHGIHVHSCSVHSLRHLLVDEWVANKQEYEPFFQSDNIDFDEEVEQYRKSGMYATSLGDAMLLGLSNALRLQIIVFTSIPSWPYTPISPRNSLLSQHPMYLAYQHTGSGHYSLAISKDKTKELTPQDAIDTREELRESKRHCRCGLGRNKKDPDRVNCCNQKTYATRCPCVKAHAPCNAVCQCQNCGNQHGKRPEEVVAKEVVLSEMTRRKRVKHPQQDNLRQAGWKFMKKEKEQAHSGIWRPHEHYVFYAIMSHLRSNEKPLQVKEIASLYAKTKEVVDQDSILTTKTESQVQCKLLQFFKEEDVAKVCGAINYLS